MTALDLDSQIGQAHVHMKRALTFVVLLFGCAPADECDELFVACEDNVAVSCSSRSIDELQSYLQLRREACGEGFCRVSQGMAFCAIDVADDPNCPANLRDQYQASGCVNGVLTTWRFGARISTATCSATTICLALDGDCNGEAYCVANPTIEPLCENVFNRCVDEQIIAYCRCGLQIDAHACENPGPRCLMEGSVAVCRP